MNRCLSAEQEGAKTFQGQKRVCSKALKHKASWHVQRRASRSAQPEKAFKVKEKPEPDLKGPLQSLQPWKNEIRSACQEGLGSSVQLNAIPPLQVTAVATAVRPRHKTEALL